MKAADLLNAIKEPARWARLLDAAADADRHGVELGATARKAGFELEGARIRLLTHPDARAYGQAWWDARSKR